MVDEVVPDEPAVDEQEVDEEFLTAGQREAFGRFVGPPSVEDLERCFLLDDEDRKLVAKRRGDANRLGFALQLTTVRYLGTFLDDPLDVPAVVLDDLAGQLGIADASQVKGYLERRPARFEHRWEICEVDGWSDFADYRQELTRWIDHRAWATGDGSRVIFGEAVVWLRRRQVLLPAVKELERLVAHVVLAAHTRFWQTVADLAAGWQAQVVRELLDVPPGRRISRLEELRRKPVDQTATGLRGAVKRVGQVAEIGLGRVDLSVVPRWRVVDLARVGMRANATTLRRMRPRAQQSATLVATAVELEAQATDDALELFDLVMTRVSRSPPAVRVSRGEQPGQPLPPQSHNSVAKPSRIIMLRSKILRRRDGRAEGGRPCRTTGA